MHYVLHSISFSIQIIKQAIIHKNNLHHLLHKNRALCEKIHRIDIFMLKIQKIISNYTIKQQYITTKKYVIATLFCIIAQL